MEKGRYPMGSIRLVSMLSMAGLFAVVVAISGPRAIATAQDSSQTTVGMTDQLMFVPADIVVPAGAEINWVNEGVVPHTVTADGGAFDSGQDPASWLMSGAVFSLVLDEPGTYTYHCAVPGHAEMGMVGTVTVQ